MLFSPQIPLQLNPRSDGRFDGFVAGPNGAVVKALKGVAEQTGSHAFLCGGEGSGKTHLLNALCHQTREQQGRAFYLAFKRVPKDTPKDAIASLQGLEQLDLVCVDDIHLVAGDQVWEEALFHCFNRIRETQGRLVVSSRIHLSALRLGLPDLASRLAWGLQLQLVPLKDHDKLAVMVKYSETLGIKLPEDVQRYLLNRQERRLSALLQSVEKLHHLALTHKRRITVPLAREALKVLAHK